MSKGEFWRAVTLFYLLSLNLFPHQTHTHTCMNAHCPPSPSNWRLLGSKCGIYAPFMHQWHGPKAGGWWLISLREQIVCRSFNTVLTLHSEPRSHSRWIGHRDFWEGSCLLKSFCRGSFRPRSQTGASCIAGGFFANWAIRDAPHSTQSRESGDPLWDKTSTQQSAETSVTLFSGLSDAASERVSFAFWQAHPYLGPKPSPKVARWAADPRKHREAYTRHNPSIIHKSRPVGEWITFYFLLFQKYFFILTVTKATGEASCKPPAFLSRNYETTSIQHHLPSCLLGFWGKGNLSQTETSQWWGPVSSELVILTGTIKQILIYTDNDFNSIEKKIWNYNWDYPQTHKVWEPVVTYLKNITLKADWLLQRSEKNVPFSFQAQKIWPASQLAALYWSQFRYRFSPFFVCESYLQKISQQTRQPDEFPFLYSIRESVPHFRVHVVINSCAGCQRETWTAGLMISTVPRRAKGRRSCWDLGDAKFSSTSAVKPQPSD